MQPRQGIAQILELGRIDREETAEHHLLRCFEAWQGLVGGFAVVGDGVADMSFGDFLDLGGDEADFAGTKAIDQHLFGGEIADAFDLIGGARGHHADLVALFQFTVDDPHQDDNAEIGVVPGIDQQRLERSFGIALGRRQTGDDTFQHCLNVEAGLGGNRDGVGSIDADHVLDLLLDPLRFSGG